MPTANAYSQCLQPMPTTKAKSRSQEPISSDPHFLFSTNNKNIIDSSALFNASCDPRFLINERDGDSPYTTESPQKAERCIAKLEFPKMARWVALYFPLLARMADRPHGRVSRRTELMHRAMAEWPESLRSRSPKRSRPRHRSRGR